MAFYAVGAWGLGNIGDDAILDGMKRQYTDLIPVHSAGETAPAGMVTPEAMMAALTEEDTLLLGGGGLFHSGEVVRDILIPFFRTAKETGCRLQVSRCGLEPGCSLLGECLSLFDDVDVRSPWSLGVCHELGIPAAIQQDWAWNVLPQAAATITPQANVGRLIVPKLESTEDADALCERLSALADPSAYTVLIHVPVHALAGALCESSYVDVLADAHVIPATSWQHALSVYMRADFVLTDRYHGAVFAKAAGVQWSPMSDRIKVQPWNVI